MEYASFDVVKNIKNVILNTESYNRNNFNQTRPFKLIIEGTHLKNLLRKIKSTNGDDMYMYGLITIKNHNYMINGTIIYKSC